MTQVSAKLRSARVSSQKARLVADQIRGKGVGEALDLLTFDLQKSAHIVKKVLESAIANAEHNNGLDIDNLFIKEMKTSGFKIFNLTGIYIKKNQDLLTFFQK